MVGHPHKAIFTLVNCNLNSVVAMLYVPMGFINHLGGGGGGGGRSKFHSSSAID